jgi:hypothetical protein
MTRKRPEVRVLYGPPDLLEKGQLRGCLAPPNCCVVHDPDRIAAKLTA